MIYLEDIEMIYSDFLDEARHWFGESMLYNDHLGIGLIVNKQDVENVFCDAVDAVDSMVMFLKNMKYSENISREISEVNVLGVNSKYPGCNVVWFLWTTEKYLGDMIDE